MAFGDLVERTGRMVRLEGITEFLVEADLVACPCGCRQFAVLYTPQMRRQRIACKRCISPKREEVLIGTLSMKERKHGPVR